MLKPFLTGLFLILALVYSFAGEDDQEYFTKKIRPLIKENCMECHRTGDPKGGVNFDLFENINQVVQKGQLWLKVLEQIKSRQMPPDTEPALSNHEYEELVEGIDKLLLNSLKKTNPNRVVVRRLSHAEYQYSVEDLLQVHFDARSYFPADGSGGGGFDNQARALYMTPLKMERYYEAAETIVNQLYEDKTQWRQVVPTRYKQSWWQQLINWVKSWFGAQYSPINPPEQAAAKIIEPLASKAYRRFLKPTEKAKLETLFSTVYSHYDSLSNPRRFDESIAQVLKAILVSPNFLYRVEEENDINRPYLLSDFEMASRLSYFLWSSMPDQELLHLAYEEKLQDTVILAQQVQRMLKDPKARRFATSFSSQWFGISKLIENKPLADPEKFPEFTPKLRRAMYDETVNYFYHVLTQSKNFLDLINSKYSFLNEELARFYEIDGITGDSLQFTRLTNPNRGGLLGMASILTASSLPTRTSPVLRGKWVLEQLLGTPPPPPPAEVGELPEDEAAHADVGLRKLLEIHRSKPGCQSCHEKMDPLGLGLENFDAIGRWRESYGSVKIDASGVMNTGESFNNPAELKEMLLTRKSLFARNLSAKMLSYALGRSVRFSDEPALRSLEQCLMENDFNTEQFIIKLVQSYPFRYKINDSRKKSNEV